MESSSVRTNSHLSMHAVAISPPMMSRGYARMSSTRGHKILRGDFETLESQRPLKEPSRPDEDEDQDRLRHPGILLRQQHRTKVDLP